MVEAKCNSINEAVGATDNPISLLAFLYSFCCSQAIEGTFGNQLWLQPAFSYEQFRDKTLKTK